VKNFLWFLVLIFSLFLIFGFGCKAQKVPGVAVEEPVAKEQLPEKPEEVKEAEAVQEPEPLPQHLQELMDEAEGLYQDGLYSEANQKYRSVVLAIEASDVPAAQEYLERMQARYEETREIVDKARIHHGNAMKLQYEKRFEEAIGELEMALDIYPKYQPAIDALDSLKSLAGLQ